MLWSYGKIVNILLLYRLMTFEVQSCFNLYGVNRKEKGWSQKANKNVSLKKNLQLHFKWEIKLIDSHNKGFIQSTDHRSTDHRPLTHRCTDPSTTNQPTDPTITDPPTRLCFKDSKIWRYSFYRIQTQLEKWKTILWRIIYLRRIQVFDRITTFAFIT